MAANRNANNTSYQGSKFPRAEIEMGKYKGQIADAVQSITALQNAANVVVQSISTVTGAVATTTTAIPADNTIPQNTEGAEVLSASITPQSSGSKLRVKVSVMLAHSSTSIKCTAALFQDDDVDAVAAMGHSNAGANGTFIIEFTYETDSPATTASTTFSVRVGGNTGSTLTFNGSAGTGLYGGVAVSTLTIEEITQ